jgi:hypothetical protein
MTTQKPTTGALILYDEACRRLAEAVRVDEVKHIHDSALPWRPMRGRQRTVRPKPTPSSFECGPHGGSMN